MTSDNKEYLVKNRQYKLAAGTPYPIRFYVEYNASEPIPRLISFRLNAKTLCPEEKSTTEIPLSTIELFTDKEVTVSTIQSSSESYLTTR